MGNCVKLLGLILLWGALALTPLYATEYSSDNFKILDPTINSGGTGAASSSTSYRLHGVISEVGIGNATATSFQVNAGSLAYPTATAPVLTATAGNGLAALSWTASQGAGGWTISGYDVCQGTTSNVYSCTDVGNVITSTRTGLTNGTPYFFRIRAKDAFANPVIRSNEATVTPVSSGGGGGGGSAGSPSGSVPTVADVIMSGRAYPNASVSLFQNGLVARVINAGMDGAFAGTIAAVPTGRLYTFGAQARDRSLRASILITYTVNVPMGVAQVSIGNIFLPPTIELSSARVTQGDPLTVQGNAFPLSTVRVEAGALDLQTVLANGEGVWLADIPTASIERGDYLVRAYAQVDGEISDASAPQSLTIAGIFEPVPEAPVCSGADINGDSRVNIADVSIALTFWGEQNPSNECADINGDGIVDLIDFSILLFYWTG